MSDGEAWKIIPPEDGEVISLGPLYDAGVRAERKRIIARLRSIASAHNNLASVDLRGKTIWEVADTIEKETAP